MAAVSLKVQTVGKEAHSPRCSRCKNAASVRVEYAKLDLCSQCFTSRFEDRIGIANRKYGLLRRGDRVAVAVSGGKDSAAMLFALSKFASKVGGIELLPVLVDEGIVGYRNKAMVCARDLCKTLGFTLQVFSYKELFGGSMDDVMVAREVKAQGAGSRAGLLHSCGYCGVFRKQALNIAAMKVGANKLALGHNADDFAQTLLMNLGNNQLEKISDNAVAHSLDAESGLVPRIKPLVLNPEIECALYARLNGLPFYRGGCPYASEGLRGKVKDFLNEVEEGTPGFKLNLADASLKLQQLLAQEKKYGSGKLSTCSECGEPTTGPLGRCRACELASSLGFSARQAQ